MAGWLETTSISINDWPLHETFRVNEWVVPLTQSIHIMCVGIVLSSSLIVALRAFSVVGADWTLVRWQDRLSPWIFVALVVLLMSGSVLTIAEPERELLNSIFQRKMVIVLVATLLTILLGRRIATAGPGGTVSGGQKLLALLILILWALAVMAGRWIAYAG